MAICSGKNRERFRDGHGVLIPDCIRSNETCDLESEFDSNSHAVPFRNAGNHISLWLNLIMDQTTLIQRPI